MITKTNRLRKRTEFAYSIRHGKRVFDELINLVVFTRRDKLLRIGFVISKKVDKRAVVRNLIRRRMQAIVREILPKISLGHNLVFIATPDVVSKDFYAIKDSVKKVLQRAGILSA